MQSALSYIYQNFPFFEYVEDLKKTRYLSLLNVNAGNWGFSISLAIKSIELFSINLLTYA